jgi:hypothetical protein
MATAMYDRITADIAFYEKKHETLVRNGYYGIHPKLSTEMQKLIKVLKTLKAMS